jgi:hypothetical protein
MSPMDHASITKVAEAMVAVLGSSAPTEARKKAAEALDAGDEGAFRAWHLIMKAARLIAGDGKNSSAKP